MIKTCRSTYKAELLWHMDFLNHGREASHLSTQKRKASSECTEFLLKESSQKIWRCPKARFRGGFGMPVFCASIFTWMSDVMCRSYIYIYK